MSTPRPTSLAWKYQPYLIALGLAILTCAVYWRVLGCGFTNYDDGQYVLQNDHVKTGLSLANLIWAFNVGYASNWHPLTWISHMTDCALFGLRPAGHHAMNLLFHVANTMLLFLVLNRLTKLPWRSAFVAALFAIHPLHVESVAWIAERKDVLSTLLWFVTIWAYIRYAERPSPKRYIPVLLFLGLGLMSKPMLVTLPFVLLLLDYWPLARLRGDVSKPKRNQLRRWPGWTLILEKVPLFALTLVSSGVTYYAQQHGGALRSLQDFPLSVRVANSITAYCGYIAKMLSPTKLAVMYPHPGTSLPTWQVVGSAMIVIAVTVLVIRARGRRPYLLTGWMWYVITLIPVIGVVQVGTQAMADRYTYVPLIGLFIMIAWGIPDLVRISILHSQTPALPHPHTPTLSKMLPIPAGLAIVVFGALTWAQIGHWQNSLTLFEYATRTTRNNSSAWENLGCAYADKGDWTTAEKCFAIALKIHPVLYELRYSLGLACLKACKYDAAVEEFTEALRLKPDLEPARAALDEAVARKRGAQGRKIRPADVRRATDHFNHAVAAGKSGDTAQAVRELKEAIRLGPGFAEAYAQLGVTLKNRGDYAGAIAQYKEAIRFKPSLTQAHNNLAVVYFMQGRYADAWKEIHQAQEYGFTANPQFLDALSRKMPDPGGKP